MKKEDLKLLKALSEVNGISGNEIEVAKLVKKEIEPFVDSIEFDNLGSIIATKKGIPGGPKVLLAGHMDEVGFMVAKVEANGMLRLHPIGGWWNHVILAEVMQIVTRNGKVYFGVVGAQPPHGMSPEMRNKVLETKSLYVDLGVASDKEVEKLGIKVGDPVVPYTEFRVLNDGKTLLGKAWDDRIGVAIGIEVMKRLQNEKLACDVSFAGTVQEEVGLRGARTASHFVSPDIAFAIDVTMSYDLPDSPNNPTKLGAGVALSVLDGSVIAHRGLFEFVENVAKANKIKYTYDMLTAGGTDSGEIHKQNDGVITMTLSLACRYFHSHTSLIHYDDYEAAVNLLVEVIKGLDANKLAELKKSKYSN